MSKKIKLYKIKSFVFTPFDNKNDLKYLEKNGIILTDNIWEADIFISQNYKHIKKFFLFSFLNKKFLIWTLEPRFNTCFKSEKKFFGGLGKCHFMNIYTGDVFTTGLNFHAKHINKELEYLSTDYSLVDRRIVALMSYFNGLNSPDLIKDGENIDLIKLRTQIALEGNKRDILDIIGRGWPDGFVIENSRKGNWKDRKNEILKNYNFNLCFENTIAYNYITEKIWDSIENFCLPIYFGTGNNIYQFFPKNSFIDYSEFNDPVELFDFIMDMKDYEFIARMNKCIQTYNEISAMGKEFVGNQRKLSLDKIVEKVHQISN